MSQDTNGRMFSPSAPPSSPKSALISSWLDTYSEQNHQTPQNKAQGKKGKHRQRPEAHAQASPHFWQHDPRAQLVTTSTCKTFTLGTGSSLFKDIICPIISRTTTELLFVTCFWAESPSLAFLGDALRGLAKKALIQQRQHSAPHDAQKRIRVRISFSSLSLFQKLFHTRSPRGQTYPPSTWVSKLGLPSPEELLPGLDMTVTSFFWLPFSVMHPKFVVVDRKVVALPSCNVSWEDWFEGCMIMTDDGDGAEGAGGGIVEKFVRYSGEGWAMDVDKWDGTLIRGERDGLTTGNYCGIEEYVLDAINSSSNVEEEDDVGITNSNLPLTVAVGFNHIPTVFLPSSAHVNPHFRPFPWQKTYPPPPPTPLNTFLTTALSRATSSIYIQTPNLTCRPVLENLLSALDRGVNVTIVTSEKLMVLEQLVTAGRTTKMCVKELVARHKKMSVKKSSRAGGLLREERLEEGLVNDRKLGVLNIMFFQPIADPSTPSITSAPRTSIKEWQKPNPVQSHLKLTVIDEEIIVLGSGNMDRASWYTSRELGVAYVSTEIAGRLMAMLLGHDPSGAKQREGEGLLQGRTKKYYNSGNIIAAT